MIQRCSLQTGTGRWILTATLLSSGVSFLLGAAVVVALPTIQSVFNAGLSQIQWIVNAYLLGLSSLLLIFGSMGDLFGRKKILLIGLVIFTIGAVLSGLSPNIGLLIAFQALLGIGSAMMVPQSLAMINACFEENQRGQVIGLWAGLSGAVAAIGPWMGGWMTQNYGWPWVFYMTVPLSLLALLVTFFFVPENRNPEDRWLDIKGTLLILLSLFGLAYSLISGPSAGWSSPPVLTGLIGGGLCLLLFLLNERRHNEPLVPLSIFNKPMVAGANLLTLFLYFTLNGMLFFLVLNLQQVQKYTAAEAGLAVLPPVVLITVLAGPFGSLADRIGPKIPMVLGPLLTAAGAGLLITGGRTSVYAINYLPGLVLFGIGMALVIPPLTKSALAVEPELSGAASGVNNAVARMAGLMAVAVLGAVMLSTFSARLETGISSTNLPVAEQHIILGQADHLGNIEIPATIDKPTRTFLAETIDDSFIYGFRRIMVISVGLILTGMLINLFITSRKQPHD